MSISRFRLISPDPAGLADFYARAFQGHRIDSGVAIGQESIEIVSGRAEAREFAANATGFQHFAIVVRDIDAAFAFLSAQRGWRAISLAGLERLPPSSGGASAFKFRDPDGHPLELLQFPPQALAPVWAERFARAPEALFHGLDHTALTVTDADAALRFYETLGFRERRRQINQGAEQARLDGLPEGGAVSTLISSLASADDRRPGIELLQYLTPRTRLEPASDGGAFATAIVLAGSAEQPTRDPDGHRVIFSDKT